MGNFAWIGTWAITNRCNLSCTYCQPRRLPASAHENIDYGRAVKSIGEIRPKVLNISGGEPSLVRDIADILRQIKEDWDPFIRIVSNGTRTGDLASCIPWFDRLVVSLDGLGETNRKTRGVDGYRVLEETRKFRDEALERGGELPEIVINEVVTVENADEVRALAEAVREIDPGIEIALSALIPNDHPLSISRHPQVWDRFWKTYEALRSEGFPIWEHFGYFKTCKPVRMLVCYNQFFVVRFRPDGTPVSCSPDFAEATRHGGKYFREILRRPYLIPKAAGRLAHLAAGAVSRKPRFRCGTPCNCESWIDFLITGTDHSNLDYYLKPLWGRLSREEVERAVTWIKTYVNPGFPEGKLDPLIGKRSRGQE